MFDFLLWDNIIKKGLLIKTYLESGLCDSYVEILQESQDVASAANAFSIVDTCPERDINREAACSRMAA